jgi:hypothetical protein
LTRAVTAAVPGIDRFAVAPHKSGHDEEREDRPPTPLVRPAAAMTLVEMGVRFASRVPSAAFLLSILPRD